MDRLTDRPTGRSTERPADGQRDRQADRLTDRRTDRQKSTGSLYLCDLLCRDSVAAAGLLREIDDSPKLNLCRLEKFLSSRVKTPNAISWSDISKQKGIDQKLNKELKH